MDAMRTFSCWPRWTAGSSGVALSGYSIRSITPASDSSHLSIGPISYCDHPGKWARAIALLDRCDSNMRRISLYAPESTEMQGSVFQGDGCLTKVNGKIAVVTGA